jgi:thiamine-monophosphate kinase
LPLAEKSLIKRIRSRARRSKHVVLGIGDDCGILRVPDGHEVLVTTDFCLEGVHFRRGWHSAEMVGRRCLTRGLSDVAAMGGEPVAAFLSLALPARLPQGWVDGFLRGFRRLGDEFDVPLAGGDIAESPNGVLADIVVVGVVPKGKAIRRSGARAGDRIYLTGELGGSAAALEVWRSGRKVKPGGYPRHFHPVPRIAVGKWLREHGIASAMIDTSDGLSTDLAHISEESGLGAELNEDLIPRATAGKGGGEVDLRFALHGGEDYELLFTARKNKRVPDKIAGVRITEIGAMVPGSGVYQWYRGRRRRLKAEGWEHFKRRS